MFELGLQYISSPIVITIFGIVCYYFGKLISEVRVRKETRFETYRLGLMFIMCFVLIPLIIATIIFPFIALLGWYPYVLLFLQIMILIFLWLRCGGYVLERQGVINYFKEKYRRALKDIAVIKKNYRIPPKSENNFFEKILFYKISTSLLFALSLISLIVTLLILFQDANIYYGIFSILIEFVILSALAILYGYSQTTYEDVEILTDRGKIAGKLLKDERDRLIVRQGQEIVYVNFNKVQSFKRSVFKK